MKPDIDLSPRHSLVPGLFLFACLLAFLPQACAPEPAFGAEISTKMPPGFDLIWWITVVEVPALAGLFWLIWRTRRDSDEERDELRHRLDTGLTDLRENLAAHKLTVAQTYASIAHLKETERRLTGHLVRIEDKLDRTVRPLAALAEDDL
ncbi:MAG: hypothetical protein ACPGOV_13355 [Magnetovibrionaceae bacterium]